MAIIDPEKSTRDQDVSLSHFYHPLPFFCKCNPEVVGPSSENQNLIHGNNRLIYEIKTKQMNMVTIWHTSQELPINPEYVG